MTDTAVPTDWRTAAMQRRVRARYAAERRFRAAGVGAVVLSLAALAFLMVVMAARGAGGFTETRIALPIALPAGGIDVEEATARAADRAFGAYGGRAVLADGAWLRVRDLARRDPARLRGGTVVSVPVATDLDIAWKGRGTPRAERTVAALRPHLTRAFDAHFLTGADATDAARVGIWGALKGSLLTMLVTIAIAFPVGVLSAVYLEEYAPRNRLTDVIEVSISNLAAVPSIIFGLLGLALLLGTFHLPRSAPLVGGLTLALMTMPVIVIASRLAIRAVPPSIRDAARALGASRIQVVFHHVLPLALPGIMTGTIIGMARALGETAPLLLIGMRAFIASPPGSLADPATVLPVQIFLWSDEISKGYVEKTSAAIIVLLALLLTMNALAVHLRRRFEVRW